MANKNISYYTKERMNLYNSLVSKLSRDVVFTQLSFGEFVKKYFNHHTQDEFGNQIELAKFHKELANLIIENDKFEAIIQLARNHAKTTVFGLFLPIYMMLHGDIHFMLFVGNSKDNAVKQLINIQTELETNELLINDFGEFVERGTWARGNFIVDRYDTAFYCVGKGQSTRGLKYRHYRPDFVLLDDIDTDKDVLNSTILTKQTNWVLQSVFPAMAIKKYKFVVLGNKFAPDMVLTRLMTEIEGVKILKINAFTDTGEVAWSERFSTKDLLNIQAKIGTIRFKREYMNDPIVEGLVFNPDFIEFFKLTSQKFDYEVIYIDPSFKKQGDFKACVTVGYADNTYYILDIYERKVTMETLFNYVYKHHKRGTRIYIEANFAQDLHKETYQKMEKKHNYSLPIVWDKTKKPNKIARIENMSTLFENASIKINESLKDTPDFAQWYLEYITFPTSKHDDGLDATESAISVIDKNTRMHQPFIVGARQTKIY